MLTRALSGIRAASGFRGLPPLLLFVLALPPATGPGTPISKVSKRPEFEIQLNKTNNVQTFIYSIAFIIILDFAFGISKKLRWVFTTQGSVPHLHVKEQAGDFSHRLLGLLCLPLWQVPKHIGSTTSEELQGVEVLHCVDLCEKHRRQL